MAGFTIVLGNKRYSSWSLRGWLALRQTGAAFEEIVIPLRRPDTAERIAALSPSGKVPTLIDETTGRRLVVWDSLAIAEYLAERFPDAKLWPAAAEARARARSVAAEMHSGFAALRQNLPMDLALTNGSHGGGEAVARDVARISEIWRGCRADAEGGGDFLFGAFSAPDVAYAPVATRFASYGVALDPVSAAYRDAVLAHPFLEEWRAAAALEPWTIAF